MLINKLTNRLILLLIIMTLIIMILIVIATIQISIHIQVIYSIKVILILSLASTLSLITYMSILYSMELDRQAKISKAIKGLAVAVWGLYKIRQETAKVFPLTMLTKGKDSKYDWNVEKNNKRFQRSEEDNYNM